MNGLTKMQELASTGVYNMNQIFKMSEEEKARLKKEIEEEKRQKERQLFEKEHPVENLLSLFDELTQ